MNKAMHRKDRPADFKKRFVWMMVGIVGMGIVLSFLVEVSYGTDPASYFNLALSERTGISYGTCNLLMNVVLFIPMLIFGRSRIGIGTAANMVLIGYICDFCRWLWARLLPPALFTLQPARGILFAVSAFLMAFCAALYMNANLGLVPYDAAPVMLAEHVRIPFYLLRIGWDFLFLVLGVLLGKKLGLATPCLVVLFGPTVKFIGNRMHMSVVSQKEKSS